MEAIIEEAIITEVKKRPLLYENISSEEGADGHELLWVEVCTAVVPNWNTLNQAKKSMIGKFY